MFIYLQIEVINSLLLSSTMVLVAPELLDKWNGGGLWKGRQDLEILSFQGRNQTFFFFFVSATFQCKDPSQFTVTQINQTFFFLNEGGGSYFSEGLIRA